MICGSDFIQDLIGLTDILKPVVDLMFYMQSIHHQVWKLKHYCLKLRDASTEVVKGIPQASPTLSKVIKGLNLGGA